MKIITQNKKAFFDYEIYDRLEAGIVLTGDEVKSLREGHVSLVGAFATVHDGELWLINCNITPYARAYTKSDELATRSRKLLLHRRELDRLIGDISKKGVTVVALTMKSPTIIFHQYPLDHRKAFNLTLYIHEPPY